MATRRLISPILLFSFIFGVLYILPALPLALPPSLPRRLQLPESVPQIRSQSLRLGHQHAHLRLL